MVGEITGLTEFTVTDSGEEITVSEDEQALRDAAVVNYTAYVRDQAGALLTGTQEFTTAYLAGDLDLARELYPRARMHYERIEPTAEAFGDIDPALDLREAELQPGENRIEVFTLFGDLRVIVPPGLRVESHGSTMLGDTKVELGSSPTQPGPYVSLYVSGGFGDVKIKAFEVGEKPPKRWRWF